MKTLRSLLVTMLCVALALPLQAQVPPTPPPSPAPAPSSGAKTFSQEELEQLLAPIALYPDALLAQVLMASPQARLSVSTLPPAMSTTWPPGTRLAVFWQSWASLPASR